MVQTPNFQCRRRRFDIWSRNYEAYQWLSSKESACQCRRHRFDPWVRKIPWRRKWQPTLGFLPWKYHGQRSLADCTPWGCKRVRYNLAAKQHHLGTKSPHAIQCHHKRGSLLCLRNASEIESVSHSVLSYSVRPHRWQPTRLRRPWDSPGKNIGVGCHFLHAWKWKVKVKSPSHVQLVATPWTAAYQAPPPMRFSRQEYWSGVPLPSPLCDPAECYVSAIC